MSNAETFDVIVIGGGPAGSTAATFVAMRGHRVLLLEKETMPVYKIGESLLPSTIHGICPMLGVTQALKEANFVTKLGGTFLWGRNLEPWTFSFAASSRIPGPTSTAYQVERIKFDMILLSNAKKKGVDVRQRYAAAELLEKEGRVVGVRFVHDGGGDQVAYARYVIDASGHSGLSKRPGERTYSQFFQNIALFGYYKGGGRLPSPNQGNIFSVSFPHGWFWYIPLSAELTSVGAVIGKESASLISGGLEAAMNAFITQCPRVAALLAGAERVTNGIYGKLRTRKDYSYCHNKFYFPGLVLVGDSACFVDPVFSSGVHLATYSALLAARSISSCLEDAMDEGLAFGEFERRYRREFSNFYDFLLAFYDLNQDSDSYFWHARRVINSAEQDNQAFINLVAGVGSTGEQLFPSGEDYIKQRNGLGIRLFGETAGHNSHITQEDRQERKRFYRNLLNEVSQLQLQASLQQKRPPESPLFKGGLVPSLDGLRWRVP